MQVSQLVHKGMLEPVVNFNFYIKEKFTGGSNKKKIRVYTIEGLMSIEHIKEQLNLKENDRSIE